MQKHTLPISTGGDGDRSRREKMASNMSTVCPPDTRPQTQDKAPAFKEPREHFPDKHSAVLNSKQKAA